MGMWRRGRCPRRRARAPHDDSDPLDRLGPLREHEGREDNGEDRLELEDQGGQARRHTGVEAGVEEGELPQRHGGPDDEHLPQRPGGSGDEGDRGDDHEEAQRDEDQRWHADQAALDDHEVGAPDRRDEDCGEGMAGGHRSIVPDPW